MSYVIKSAGDDYFEIDEIPFRLSFNFHRLFEYWEGLAKKNDEMATLAKPMLKKLEQYALLKEPLQDIDLLETHSKILSKLFFPMFPELTTTNEIQAIGIPFTPIWFNVTERFRGIIDKAGGASNVKMRVEGSMQIFPK